MKQAERGKAIATRPITDTKSTNNSLLTGKGKALMKQSAKNVLRSAQGNIK